jgi:hypothetical protein
MPNRLLTYAGVTQGYGVDVGKLLVLVGLLAGCEVEGGEVDCATHSYSEETTAAPGGASEAVLLVWHSAYGMETAPPKRIHWIAADYFIRADSQENVRGIRCSSYGTESIWVATRFSKPSGTFLAHELTHAALARRGDSDSLHAGAEWEDLAEVNAMLAEAGL